MPYMSFGNIHIVAYHRLLFCTSVNRCGDRVYLWRTVTSPLPLESLELHDNTAENNRQEFIRLTFNNNNNNISASGTTTLHIYDARVSTLH